MYGVMIRSASSLRSLRSTEWAALFCGSSRGFGTKIVSRRRKPEPRTAPSGKVYRLVEEVAALSLTEAWELNNLITKKIETMDLPRNSPNLPGTIEKAAAAAAAAAAARSGPVSKKASSASASSVETAKVKSVFNLRLDGFDAASKIKVIKEVRSFTELGLKEAKDLVEKLPAVLKKGVSKEDGDALLEKLKAVGAKAVLE